MDRKLKLKVINKLLDAGFDDEKKVMNFAMKDMLVCDIKGEEIGVVLELQDATKSHKVISFLADEKEEEYEDEVEATDEDEEAYEAYEDEDNSYGGYNYE